MLDRRCALSLLSFVLACGDPVTQEPAGQSCEEQQTFPIGSSFAVDLLFVIDDSEGTTDFSFSQAAADWSSVLRNIEGGLPDIRVGVVSATAGSELTVPAGDGACGLEDGAAYLADPILPWWECEGSTEPCRVPNYSGSFADALACLVDLGSEVSEPPSPLASLLNTLTSPLNSGFRRDNAFLVVIIVSSGDDSSTAGVSEYAEQFRALVTPGLGIFGIIAPSESQRLIAFADEFPSRATVVDIAEGDWSDALVQVADSLAATLGLPCLRADTADVHPEELGIQVACSSEAVTAVFRETLPNCVMDSDTQVARGSPRPCYWLEFSPGCGDEQLEVHFEFPPGVGRADIQFRCECADGSAPEPLDPPSL